MTCHIPSTKHWNLNESRPLISAAPLSTHIELSLPTNMSTPLINATPATGALLKKLPFLMAVKLNFIWIHIVWLWKHLNYEIIVDMIIFSIFEVYWHWDFAFHFICWKEQRKSFEIWYDIFPLLWNTWRLLLSAARYSVLLSKKHRSNKIRI